MSPIWKDLFKKVPNVSEEAENAFGIIRERANSPKPVTDFEEFIDKQNLADESLKKFLRDTNYATKDLATYKQYLRDTGQETTKFASFTKAAGGVLKSFGAMALNMAISTGISMLIGWAFSEISDLINRSEQLQKKAKEISENINTDNKSVEKDKKTLAELSERYEILSQGVSTNGKNISLTTDEYEEYNNIISQISEIMPNFTQYFSDQNETIAKSADNVDKLTQAYRKYRQEEARKFFTDEDDGDTQAKVLIDAYNDATQKETSSLAKDGLRAWETVSFGGVDVHSRYTNEEIIQLLKKFKALDKNNARKILSMNFMGTVHSNNYSYLDSIALEEIFGLDEDEIDEMTEEDFNSFKKRIDNYIKQYESNLDYAHSQLQQILVKALEQNFSYDNLSEDQYNNLFLFLNKLTPEASQNLDLFNEDGELVEEKVILISFIYCYILYILL